MTAELYLTKPQLKALASLAAIEEGCAFVPPLQQRPDFWALIDLGLASSRGPGLGGEGFSPTPAGRLMFEGVKDKSRRGFASMSPERRREIARKGGKSVDPRQRAFSKDPELAARAGTKGGAVSGATRKKPSGGA